MNFDEPFNPEPQPGEPRREAHAPLAVVRTFVTGSEPGTHNGFHNNHGKRGHPPARGRPPSFVRAVSRQSYMRRIPLLRQIADGTIWREVTVVTRGGSQLTYRVYPSILERLKAVDILGKYGGLVTTVDANVDEDEDATPEVPGYDFSLLSTEQVEVLQSLLQAARVTSEEGVLE